MLLGEVAAIILKIHGVNGHNLAIQLGLDFEGEVIEVVPVDEVPLLATVCMEVAIVE